MTSKYTHLERASMAFQITDAMRDKLEAQGEDLEMYDFEDGERHLRDDADDNELQAEYTKYVNKEQS